MTDHAASRSRRPAPARIVWLLLVADIVLLIPVGVILVELAIARPSPHWDAPERAMVAALGILVVALCVGVGLGVIRYNVLGRPRVSIDDDGLWIADHRIGWGALGCAGIGSAAGVAMLSVEVPRAELGFLPWYDRLAARFNPVIPGRGPSIWITEQQLCARLAEVVDRIPAEHLVR